LLLILNELLSIVSITGAVFITIVLNRLLRSILSIMGEELTILITEILAPELKSTLTSFIIC
jgi:hypothetical protein